MRGLVIAGAIAFVLQVSGCASGPHGAAENPAEARTVKFLFSNAEGHFFKGNLTQAVAGYSEVIAADPKNAPAFRGRAAALAVLGREPKPRRLWSCRAGPGSTTPGSAAGSTTSRGRYAEAIDPDMPPRSTRQRDRALPGAVLR
jgi:hypothetical protein